MWFHDTAIENHGGRHGIRSQWLLDQAITRPQRIWYYESMDNMARLADCYTASIVFIHPFVDGNKRTGWGTANLFATANGLELVCSPEDSYQAVLGFAASPKGEHEEELLAEFMDDHLWPY
ncbi:MAG: type II toxin-antitoxin system death-on-curing family toxin [bacterium]|nr:type II toxin-antitoxin system death-on-curing family toxin [bacterium]